MYKLVLDDMTAFAVKKLTRVGGPECERGFERELATLADIKHRNLITLRGYYTTPDINLLLYDLMSNGNLDSLLHGACVFPLPPLSQFLSSWLVFFVQSLSLSLSLSSLFPSMKKKLVDHVCFSSTTSLPISLFIVFFYEEEAYRSCGFFLHHLSLNFSLFIVVFYKEEACGSCVFSLHYLPLNLFLHCCFLQRRKLANHVYFLSTISYSISLSSLLFSMKKFLYQSCFISNISLSKLNLFSFFVFYEEEA